MTRAVSGHAAMTLPTICAINLLPPASPPTRKPGISAGYAMPSSVVPRAKRTVMALQPLPLVTSFWVEEVSAAEAKGARTRRGANDFMMECRRSFMRLDD
jgi:hypothetical protein